MLLRKLLPGRTVASSSSSTCTSSTVSSILSTFLLLSALGSLPVQASDVLETNGFSTCLNAEDIKVERMNVKYDRGNNQITFDIAGTSLKRQNVTASLTVTAYGKEVYQKTFNPCTEGISQLCPLPEGTFIAQDSMAIPLSVSNSIPAIAFQIPDLDGMAKLELEAIDSGQPLACLQSVVNNGKTAGQPGVQYVTASIAAAALLLSGVSAAGSAAAGATGAATGPSPNFGDVMFWFQNIAMNGMLSVNYPPVYRSFVSNFAWSTGIIPWEDMQRSIDAFRAKTGGKLEKMSIDYLMNATLVFTDDTTANSSDPTSSTNNTRRALDWAVGEIYSRAVEVNGTSIDGGTTNTTEKNKAMVYVHGVQAYVEKLQIPSANTFMTVLLIFCIVMASLAVCILLFKVILEAWALCASFPKGLTGFRKRYWGFLAGTIVKIVLILYGTWTLYCFYQFRNGDSWGAHVLAGTTLVVFSSLLGFFAFRIFTLARRAKEKENSTEQLFNNKQLVRRYGLFYDQFKSNFWWVFLPLIIYSFAKGAFIALGDGHGLIQTAGQLACEMLLLILLVWNRPYNSKAGNVLNIIIAVVRVLSVMCLIVFVDQLGIAATTKTVTGVALIVIQSVLTAVLGLCIATNAIVVMCKENPHTKRRKELEKQREADLTPLDARNSLLGPGGPDGKGKYMQTPTNEQFSFNENSTQGGYPLHQMMPAPQYGHDRCSSSGTLSGRPLVSSAAPMSMHDRSYSGNYDEYRHAPDSYSTQAPIGVARVY